MQVPVLLTLHQHPMLEHIHLAVTRSQSIRLKRSPKYRERREKWEKIRSVSLAPGLVSAAALPALREGWGDSGPCPAFSRPLAALPEPGGALGARLSGSGAHRFPQKPPQSTGTSKGLGEYYRSRAWAASSALGCSTHHHPTTPPFPCDHSDWRQEREKPSVRFLRLFFAF